MQVTCSRCRRVLEYAADRPSFCAYCGNALTDTGSFALDHHEAETVAPAVGVPESAAPEQVGGYKLHRLIGTGGMGSVYEAEEVATGRRVAVKLITAGSAASAEALERFRREGRLASSLTHPRCVFVLHADEDVGRPYLVMELMPGKTLADLVRERGPLRPEEAVAKVLDVIDGLREAHGRGVVHRDVKPSNCFLDGDGRVKIGDFGLAKALAGGGNLTRAGAFMGTPLFASPEQVRGEPADPTMDVYSVAATLYFLLTGQAPHQTGDATATIARIVSDPAPSMRTLRPELPPALDRVVLRGLERQRERRWQNLDQLRRALLPFAPGKLSVGGLGIRFGAYLIDYLVMSVVAAPIIAYGMSGSDVLFVTDARTALAATLTQAAGTSAWILYFGISEGLWGCSLGKRLLRLRVWARPGEAPGMARAVLRAAIFLSLPALGLLVSLALWFRFEPPAGDQMGRMMFANLCGLVNLTGVILGFGLLLLPMRQRNGYRGLHEFLSGTRVVLLPAPERHPTYRAAPARPLAPPAGLPQRVGPFVVGGALSQDAAGGLLAASDEGLGRQVWVWLRPEAEPPLSPGRRELARPTRLRWLAHGRHAQLQWDAFLAPPGCPLADLVHNSGLLSWPDAGPLLRQLADELAAAGSDGTLPAALTLGHLWVQPNGQLVVLDMPLDPGDSRRGRGAALVGRAAVLLLEGKLRHPDGSDGPILAPIPEHASRMLTPLLGPRAAEVDVHRVSRVFAALQDRPAEVTRARRAGQLAVLAAFLGIGLIFMATGGCMTSFIPAVDDSMNVQFAERDRAIVQHGAYREYVVSSLNPTLPAQLGALAQLDADLRLDAPLQRRVQKLKDLRAARRRALSAPMRWYVARVEETVQARLPSPEEEAIRWPVRVNLFRFIGPDSGPAWNADEVRTLRNIALVMVGVWPLLWVLWDFLTRGGLSRRLVGLMLVRADGRPAARWQCLVRSALVWAPVLALLAGSVWLNAWYWMNWDGSDPVGWATWTSWLLWWAGFGLLALYAAVALWRPGRGPHDQLAGTYLVPR